MHPTFMNYIFRLAQINICLVFSLAMAIGCHCWALSKESPDNWKNWRIVSWHLTRLESLWAASSNREREGCMANSANAETKRQHWRHKVKLLVRDRMGWWGSAGEEEVGRHGDDGWGEGWLPIYISCHISSAFIVLVLVPLNETSIFVVVSLYLSILLMT